MSLNSQKLKCKLRFCFKNVLFYWKLKYYKILTIDTWRRKIKENIKKMILNINNC